MEEIEFDLIASQYLNVALRAHPQHTQTVCHTLSKQYHVLNSGESVLIFDFHQSLGKGSSGLVNCFSVHDLLVHCDFKPAIQEKTKQPIIMRRKSSRGAQTEPVKAKISHP
jgi:hypothetical protein